MNNLDDDKGCNTSGNENFQEVLEARMSRRNLLKNGIATAAFLSLGGVDALLRAVPLSAQTNGSALLGFQNIPVSDADTVVVPTGYTADVLISWGDPVSNGPAFKQDGNNTAADQSWQWGMHNDGIVYFPIIGSQRGLICQNNEYTDDGLLFSDGIANWDQEKTNKCLNAHGVSIIEVTKRTGFPWDPRRRKGEWDVVRPSPSARRITGMTPMNIAGPAAALCPWLHSHHLARQSFEGIMVERGSKDFLCFPRSWSISLNASSCDSNCSIRLFFSRICFCSDCILPD